MSGSGSETSSSATGSWGRTSQPVPNTRRSVSWTARTEAAEAAEEVGAGGGQEVIVAQRQRIDRVEGGEPVRRTMGQADRHRAVQLDHGRGRDDGERVVVRDDRGPVGRLPRGRARVAA